jgi:hypothetical protein
MTGANSSKRGMMHFFLLLAILALILYSPGCGGGSKSSRSGGGGGGTSTNTGTNTGNVGDAAAIDFTWGTKFNASQAWLESKADKIKTDFAVGMWIATEGQMYLNNQTFKNGHETGNVVYENEDSWTLAGGSCGKCSWATSPYRITLAGKAPCDIFLHEFCHGQFVFHGEEYSCEICVMAPYNIDMGTNKQHYCDSADCMAGSYCWDNYILKKYSGWSHTGAAPGAAPACNVTIQ